MRPRKQEQFDMPEPSDRLTQRDVSIWFRVRTDNHHTRPFVVDDGRGSALCDAAGRIRRWASPEAAVGAAQFANLAALAGMQPKVRSRAP